MCKGIELRAASQILNTEFVIWRMHDVVNVKCAFVCLFCLLDLVSNEGVGKDSGLNVREIAIR